MPKLPTVAFLLCIVTAAFGAPAAADVIPYKSGHIPTPEENRRLAQEQAEHWDEILAEIDRNMEEYDRRMKEILEATRDQRDAYDAKIDDYARAHPRDGYGIKIGQSIGEDGLYESTTIYWVNSVGTPHYRADFDKDGNTDGIVQTNEGKVAQNLKSYIESAFREDPDNVGVPVYSYETDIYGNSYPASVVIRDKQGYRRVDVKFNEHGNAWQTSLYNRNGDLIGSGYHEDMMPLTEDPGAPLETVALIRLVTQPCEPCRKVTEWRNNLAREMNAIAVDMNNVAQMHKVNKGRPQIPLRMRHEHLMSLWQQYKAEFDRADAEARDCYKRCSQPQDKPLTVVGSPVEVCAADAASETDLEAFASDHGAEVGSVTELPQGGVEGELRVPASGGNACENLSASARDYVTPRKKKKARKKKAVRKKALRKGALRKKAYRKKARKKKTARKKGGRMSPITVFGKVPCSRMADGDDAPVRRWARSAGRNTVEGQVERGRDFSGAGTAVIDRAHSADIQVRNFLAGLERNWRAGDAQGPNVTRVTPDGRFRLPVTLCPPGSGPRQSLSDRISLGSLSTVDFDRVETGVNTGLTTGRVLQRLEYLKYKYDNGLEITSEEIGGLAEDINTLRGDRFEKLGTVLDGVTTNIDRYEKIKGFIDKGNEILDFIDLASRGRDDPVVAAEALAKYLSLVGDVAGKVPGMGEFVQMYAQGVEGMVDNLRFIQQRHNMTVDAINDIEQFTNDFYDTDVDLDDAAPSSSSSSRPTKEDIDALNRYRATREEGRALENATANLRSYENCIKNGQSEIYAILRRIRDLEDERDRLGNERGLWHDYDAKRRLHAWYQNYVEANGTEATPTTQREFNWWARGRNITGRHVLDARDNLRRWRAIGPIIDGLYGEIQEIMARMEDCGKELPRVQQAYLDALRAYVEKDAYYRGLSQGLDSAEATRRARQLRDEIPATVPQPETRIAAPQGAGCTTEVTVATACEESSVVVSTDPRDTGGSGESTEEWIRRNSPSTLEDSSLTHEFDPSEVEDLNFDPAP